MKELIIASGNAHKIIEIQEILGEEFKVKGLKDLDKNIEIIEDGKSYKENALLKANAIAKYYDSYILADDSGLEIFSLPEILGIYSARFMGEDTPYEERFKDIYKLLKDKDSSARFVCGMALVTPDKKEYYVEGEIKGHIGKTSGVKGFGYDPIFMLPEYGKSPAEISPELKNELSHRGKALRLMKEKLKEVL